MKLQFSADFQGRKGDVWEIIAMQEGEIEGRDQYISADALKASLPAFDQVWVQNLMFEGGYQDHLSGEVREAYPEGVILGNVVGVADSPRAEIIPETGKTGIVAAFHAASDVLKQVLLKAQEAGMLKKIGLSINGSTDPKYLREKVLEGGRKVLEILQIDRIESFDLVTRPGAGGYFRALLASASAATQRPAQTRGGNIMIVTILKHLLDAKGITYEEGSPLNILASIGVKDGKFPAGMSTTDGKLFMTVQKLLSEGQDEGAEAMMDAVLASGKVAAAAPPEEEPDEEEPEEPENGDEEEDEEEPAAAVQASVAKKLQDLDKQAQQLSLRLSQIQVKELLDDAKLPSQAKTILASRLSGRIVEEKEVKRAIADQQKILASVSDDGQVRSFYDMVDVGFSDINKGQVALNKLFGIQASAKEKSLWQGIGPFKSFRAGYHAYTGDGERVSGRVQIQAATFKTSNFAEALANTLHRRLINLYQAKDMPWRKLVNIRPGGVPDFRNQYVVQVGGLEDLAVVAEDGEYTEITVNTDDDASYAVSTRGKIMVISRRVIKNDDIGFVQRLIQKANRAAHRTLQKFIFDLLLSYTAAINDTAIYDGDVLYHANHSNVQALALTYDNLIALRNLIGAQTEADSSEPLDLEPKYLIIPKDLEATAHSLTESEQEPGDVINDRNFINSLGLESIVVDKAYLRDDTNNYYLSVDPMVYETIEIGFLDGQEEPEVLLQDNPGVAEVFMNDRIKYKVRHEYGGCVVDYRGLAGSIV